ncbi:DeoR/GlpR family DNA-binding transcription regulator [Paenibacillus sp. PL2-23]|uniref:DeoR/GlpR family DNA-binding transcription regulator n=1 Tax=Paenibacillus sp. PL2-23 TaxID=2100729 RepID=UPI0030FC2594
MLAEERRQAIIKILERDQKVVARSLAREFNISVDSIRRDLTIMEEQGLLRKAYGGAVPIIRRVPLPDQERYSEGSLLQNSISRFAASYIQKNDTVFIGGAGIHYGMLKYLPRHFPYTVVTNSLKVSQSIREITNIESYIIGGKLNRLSGNVNDSYALEQIRRLSLDVCFITGGGITLKGFSNSSFEAANFAQAVCEVSNMAIGLAPHDKFGTDMFVRSVPIHGLDLIITDQETPQDIVESIRKLGVEVAIAPVETQGDNNSTEDCQ